MSDRVPVTPRAAHPSPGRRGRLVDGLVGRRQSRAAHLPAHRREAADADRPRARCSASRHVGLARAGGLDAIGADHGVPRLEDEDDESYRARLRIFTSGTGDAAGLRGGAQRSAHDRRRPGPQHGPAVDRRRALEFRIVDATPELAVAVRVVEVGAAPGTWREHLLDSSHANGLLFDLDSPPSAGLPPASGPGTQSGEACCGRTSTAPTRSARAALPQRARRGTSLDRATRVLEALAGSGQLSLHLGHDARGGPAPRPRSRGHRQAARPRHGSSAPTARRSARSAAGRCWIRRSPRRCVPPSAAAGA